MKQFLLTTISIFIWSFSFCQIDEFIENVVLIQSKDKAHSGSGFLFHTGSNLYLLTAKHVLIDQGNNLLFDEFAFYSYPHDAQKEKAIEYSINLNEAFNQKKLDMETILI